MVYQKIKYIVLIISLFLSGSLFSQNNKSRKYLIEGNKSYLASSYDEAAANYLRAIQEGEDSYKSNFNLGNAMFRLKKYDDAVFQYQKSIKFAANKIEKSNAYFNIGDSYYKKKEYTKAAEAFKKTLKLNPKDEKARYNYSLAKQKLEEQENKQKQNSNNKNEGKQQDQKEQKEKDQQNRQDSSQTNPQNNKEDNQQGQSGGKGSEKNKGQESINNVKSMDNNELPKEGNKQSYEGMLGAIQEQERRTQQKIINRKVPPSKGSGGKDW